MTTDVTTEWRLGHRRILRRTPAFDQAVAGVQLRVNALRDPALTQRWQALVEALNAMARQLEGAALRSPQRNEIVERVTDD